MLWSWRQRLLGPPAIDVALHSLPHSESDATPDVPPPTLATLRGVAFAPHDMALSRTKALFISSPTRVDIAPFLAGVLGPAQCTVFDRRAVLRRDGTSHIHLVERTSPGDKGDATRVEIGAPYHPVHCANAWEDEDGDHLHLVASCWPPDAVRRLARSGSSLLGSWEQLLDGDFSEVDLT